MREWLGLASVDRLREARAAAALAEEGGDAKAATAVVRDLRRLHKGRGDLEWSWRRYDEAAAGAGRPGSALALVERLVIRPLDERARSATRAAIRRTAMITAITPFPVLDMVVTLAIDLRLMRRIARIYGGRPGLLGGWRLLRLSLASVLASGALDLTDDAIGGALGAASRRGSAAGRGSGLLNGLLTRALAAAAMDLGRPFPWTEGRPPSGRRLLAEAFSQMERERPGPAGRSGRRVTRRRRPEAGSVHIRAFPYRRSPDTKEGCTPGRSFPESPSAVSPPRAREFPGMTRPRPFSAALTLAAVTLGAMTLGAVTLGAAPAEAQGGADPMSASGRSPACPTAAT